MEKQGKLKEFCIEALTRFPSRLLPVAQHLVDTGTYFYQGCTKPCQTSRPRWSALILSPVEPVVNITVTDIEAQIEKDSKRLNQSAFLSFYESCALKNCFEGKVTEALFIVKWAANHGPILSKDAFKSLCLKVFLTLSCPYYPGTEI